LSLPGVRRKPGTHYDLVIDPDPQSQSGRLLTLLAGEFNSEVHHLMT
jgi:hypothetical protein